MHIQEISKAQSFHGVNAKSIQKKLKIAAIALPLAVGTMACQQNDLYNKQHTTKSDLSLVEAIKNTIKERDQKIIEMRDSVYAQTVRTDSDILPKTNTQNDETNNWKTTKTGKVLTIMMILSTILGLLQFSKKENEKNI